MRNVDIKGLAFIQTHEENPVRFDVRDAEFNRVAYVEYENGRVQCTTKKCKVLYEAETKIEDIDIWLGHCADAIHTHIKERKERMEKALVKMWNITGYKGRDDYDGPSDNNMNFYVLMDARFKKDDVEEIFLNRFSKKHRMVVVKATEVSVHGVCDPDTMRLYHE